MPAETQMTAQACKTMEEELAKCLKENAENQVKSRDLFFLSSFQFWKEILIDIKYFRVNQLVKHFLQNSPNA